MLCVKSVAGVESLGEVDRTCFERFVPAEAVCRRRELVFGFVVGRAGYCDMSSATAPDASAAASDVPLPCTNRSEGPKTVAG